MYIYSARNLAKFGEVVGGASIGGPSSAISKPWHYSPSVHDAEFAPCEVMNENFYNSNRYNQSTTARRSHIEVCYDTGKRCPSDSHGLHSCVLATMILLRLHRHELKNPFNALVAPKGTLCAQDGFTEG